jgi:hypothetical protein
MFWPFGQDAPSCLGLSATSPTSGFSRRAAPQHIHYSRPLHDRIGLQPAIPNGHYVADAAQPLHNSMHHDGWSGPNPKGYTRDPEIHGRFESRYMDLIETTAPDVVKYMRKDARNLEDVWKATLDHSLEARDSVEEVYRADLRGAFQKKDDAEARELVYKRLAAGASFLRDLACTAWIESAKPAPRIDPIDRMENPENPKYNPAAGSAPAK